MSKKEPAPDAAEPKPRGIPKWRLALAFIIVALSLSAPFWGPPFLARFSFFHVRRIEVLGAHYTPLPEVLSRLQVDTSRSIWDPTPPLAQRVAAHPQVLSATVTRRLPGTLVVEIRERRPVALVQRAEGLMAVDESGRILPLDPSATPVDLPIVATTPHDTAVYHLLGAMQREAPSLFAQVSTVSRVGRDELLFRISDVLVRAMASVDLARLSDIEPVEHDLAQRQIRPAELDLRYRDQVIARVP